ncbi:MAG: M20/M25/M40 family metallo-hydrolase [Acidobacteriota bacterium]|nr:M20/M25/M40 family metallo-hydrolase [Acidobacteriota bacterium]
MARRFLFPIICVLWLSHFSLAQDKPQAAPAAPQPRISTPEEIAAEFNSVPCKNGDRLAAAKALFEKMGAKPEEITAEKFSQGENIVVKIAGTFPGAAAEKIVIGAHFDKTTDGCGAIDNWSGLVAVAHIYRTMKDLKLNKTVIFVGFGEEEKGLWGSRAMADKIKKEEVAEYCAMINIDSLGMAIPQAADNLSSKKLIDVTADLAKEMKMQFAHASIQGVSDSMSFASKKIPAITLHGLANDWPKFLHSSNDKPEKVNRQSVYLGYRLALALLAKMDESPCQAFREVKDDKGGKEKK